MVVADAELDSPSHPGAHSGCQPKFSYITEWQSCLADAFVEGPPEECKLDPTGDARRGGQPGDSPLWIKTNCRWQRNREQVAEDSCQGYPDDSVQQRRAR